MARGYLDYFEYCRTCNYVPEAPRAVFGILAESLKATVDFESYRLFCLAHSDELSLEQQADEKYRALTSTGWINGPSADEIAARNQAAVAADKLEIEIRQRAGEIMRNRELTERARAVSQAREELAR